MVNGALPSKAETVNKYLNQNPEPVSGSKERYIPTLAFADCS